MSCDVCQFLQSVGRDTIEKQERERRQMLKLDLSHAEYADWFLAEKIENGDLNPTHAINDFVLFRIAFDWPHDAKWILDKADIEQAGFDLSDEMASDLCDLAEEGLTDGYRPADWYLRIAVLWHVDRKIEMHPKLSERHQKALFLPPAKRQGRKRNDGIDRDRVVRNAVNGLLLRGCLLTGANGSACSIVAAALGRKGIDLTDDAIRKLMDRTQETDREVRYWRAMKAKWTR